MNDEHPLAGFKPEKQRTIEARPQVAAVRISPDGRRLAGGGFDGVVRLWDLSAEEPKARQLAGHQGWVEGLAMHGQALYTADSWGCLRAWTLGDQTKQKWEQKEAHDGWIRQIAVSPGGDSIVTCGRDQTVKKWAATDGKPLRSWNAGEDVYSVTFHPDGRLFSGDSRGSIRQWADDQDEPARAFDGSVLYTYDRIQDVGGVKSLAVDAAGDVLAAAGAIPSRGATVQGEPTLLLFDLKSGELRRTIKLGATKDCYVHDVQRHPGGFWMAVSCGTPGTGQIVFVGDEDDEPFFRETKVPNCHSISYHPESELLAVSATNKGSNGNGRRLNKEGEYEANSTPVELFQLPSKLG